MGSADYLRVGDWNVRCDRCGKKLKGSQAMQTWQGYWVCPQHWEGRQPQDFVRSISENPTPPFVRAPADIFLALPDSIILEESDEPPGPGEDWDYILEENGTTILTES